MILRAHWVLPIAAPPIEDGEVVVRNGVIVDVRKRSGMLGGVEVIDFGDAIILPGFVNAHTHLELTALRGAIEDVPFPLWIRQLVTLKAGLTEQEWRDSALWGALEAAASGTTTVVDTTDTGASLYALVQTGLRGRVYQEVFAVEPHTSVEQTLRVLEDKMQWLQRAARGTLVEIGVSPHTLYTVRPAVMEALRSYTRINDYPVCIHVGESIAEIDLLKDGTGPFAEMYNQRGIPWEPMGKHPIDILQQQSWLDAQTLLVHCVQSDSRHADLLASTGTAVAHCPQSNAKLCNGVAPLHEWQAQSVRVGLGTDSVVSNNTLDLFAEMRFAVLSQRAVNRTDSCFTAKQAVELATIGGARALGLEGQTGTLELGKQADLCVLSTQRLHNFPSHDPYATVVFSCNASDVRMTMVAGRIAFQDGEFPLLRESVGSLRERLRRTVRRVRQPLTQEQHG